MGARNYSWVSININRCSLLRALYVWVLRLYLNSFVGPLMRTPLPTTWESSLKEFEAIKEPTFFAKLLELGHLFANIVTDTKFAFWSNHFVVLLITQMLVAKWVITHYFAALRLMFFNFWEPYHRWAKTTLNSKTMDNFFNNSWCSSNFDIFMANRTVFVKNKPVFDAQFAK